MQPWCDHSACSEQDRHEHRRHWWDVETDAFWYDLTQADVQMLNEARAVHQLPRLVFTQHPLPSPERQDERAHGSAAAGSDHVDSA